MLPRLSPHGPFRFLTVLLTLALGLVLTACPRPLVAPSTATGNSPDTLAEADSVAGSISFGMRQVQATIVDDVAPGATVSLIEVETGITRSTTRTDADGKFVLKYSNGFKPTTNSLYYFEAVKGLSGGTGAPNAAGADAVRVRTIASYRRGGWVTLTSRNAASSIRISPMTTALSVVVSLRKPTSKPIDATTLFGAIRAGIPSAGYPDGLDLPDPVLVPPDLVRRAYDLVVGSLEKDRDPLRWIQLSSADASLNSLSLPSLPFSISYLDPPNAVALDTIDLVGSNFEGDPVVDFRTDGGERVRATVLGVSTDLTRITVRVPPTSVTGHIELTLGGRTLNGPIFRLDTRDGHSVVDERGNVYAANRDLGTIAILEPLAGSDVTSVRTLVPGLGEPTALTFGLNGFDSLFAASVGGKVWKAELSIPKDASLPVSFVTKTEHATGGAAVPGGMAFRNLPGDPAHGALYVSDASNHRLYVVPPAGGAAVQVQLTGMPLVEPRGMSFGPDGRLYVANAGDNRILAITLSALNTGSAAVFASGFSMPWGLAFDNRGNCYVSNFRGNSVYRVPLTSEPGVAPYVYGNVTSFASIPTPAGLDADSSGYVYVADRNSNGIYRINSTQESKQIGFGMSTPTSTWVDPDGLFLLTDTGRLLHSDKVDSTGRLRVIAQGLLTAKGLVRDTDGNFYTFQSGIDALTQIRPDGSTIQVAVGLTTSDDSGVSINGDKLYVRSTSSFDPGGGSFPLQGEVLEFTLERVGGKVSHVSGPTRRLRTPIDQLIGVGGTGGTYYTLNPRTKTFFSFVVTGSNNLSVGKRTIMTRLASDPGLVDPKDLWVSPAGLIFVADYAGGPGGTGSIRVYNAAGVFQSQITDIETPTHLNSDGTYLYANSYTKGYLRAFALTAPHGTIAGRDRTGFSAPRGFAFMGTTLVVNEWGPNRIAKIDNYATQTAITTLIAMADRTDIEVVGSTIYFIAGADVYRVTQSGATWVQEGVPFRDYDYTLYSLSNIDGKLFAIGNSYRIHDLAESSYRSVATSLFYQPGLYGYSGMHGDPSGWALRIGTRFLSYGKGDSHATFVMDTDIDGSVHRTHRLVGITLSGMVDDAAGNVYFSKTNAGTIYRLSGDSLVEMATNSPYTADDRMYGGISHHEGYLYQAIYNRHWIDRIRTSTGERTSLKLGLVTPEL